MTFTTTSTLDGRHISDYLGIIGTEVTFIVPSLTTDISIGEFAISLTNTPSTKIFETARTTATKNLIAQAKAKGANAIVGVRFDFQMVGNKNQMLLNATGTAVIAEASEREKDLKRFVSKQEQKKLDEQVLYFIQTQNGERGPISIEDLISLRENYKITDTALIRESEKDEWLPLQSIIKVKKRLQPNHHDHLDDEIMYFIQTNSGERGPIKMDDLITLKKEQSITDYTMIRQSNSEQWVLAKTLIK